MKKTLLLCLLITSSLFAQEAQELSKRQLVKQSLERVAAGEKLDDIIEKWNHLFDEQNLKRDRMQDRIEWREAFPIEQSSTQRIEGERVFYNLFKKRYHYTVVSDAENDQLVVELKLHFYPSKTYLKRIKRLHRLNHPDKKYYPQMEELDQEVAKNVKISERIWNKQAPRGVRFRFIKVDDAQKLITHSNW